MDERKTLGERESARIEGRNDADLIGGEGDLVTDHEGRAQSAGEIAPGGANTVGAGRGSAQLGNIGGADAPPDNIGGSDAGLGGGSGDLGGGGGLGDDLGDLPRDRGGQSVPDEGGAGAR